MSAEIQAIIQRLRRATTNMDVVTLCDFAATKLHETPTAAECPRCAQRALKERVKKRTQRQEKAA
jgi:hypothetical protein